MSRLKISTTIYMDLETTLILKKIRAEKPWINTAALIRISIEKMLQEHFPEYAPKKEIEEATALVKTIASIDAPRSPSSDGEG